MTEPSKKVESPFYSPCSCGNYQERTFVQYYDYRNEPSTIATVCKNCGRMPPKSTKGMEPNT